MARWDLKWFKEQNNILERKQEIFIFVSKLKWQNDVFLMLK